MLILCRMMKVARLVRPKTCPQMQWSSAPRFSQLLPSKHFPKGAEATPFPWPWGWPSMVHTENHSRCQTPSVTGDCWWAPVVLAPLISSYGPPRLRTSMGNPMSCILSSPGILGEVPTPVNLYHANSNDSNWY